MSSQTNRGRVESGSQALENAGDCPFAASMRTQILLTALLWTVVGAILLAVGLRWTWTLGSDVMIALLPLALAVGYLKSRMVLGKVARRAVARLALRGEGRSVFGVLALRSWLLIGLMMGMGRVLRSGVLPIPVVGLLYSGIGFALLTGSRQLWNSWRGIGVAGGVS